MISRQDGACSKGPLFGPDTRLQVGGFKQGSLKQALGVIKTQQAHAGLDAPDPASQAEGSHRSERQEVESVQAVP